MKKLLGLIIICSALTACIKEPELEVGAVYQETIKNFDFKSTKEVTFNVVLQDNLGEPLNGVLVEFWDIDGARIVFKTITDANGKIDETITLPKTLGQITMEAKYIGIPNSITIPIKNDRILLNYYGAINTEEVLSPLAIGGIPYIGSEANTTLAGAITFNYFGTYDQQGVPDNLEPNRDAISSTLLEYINASLPEKQPVPTYHPSYIAEGKKTTLDIIETADVWVTFVHEGAGWRNAIGFYTYPTGTPPQSLDDIDKVDILFPNLSFKGSGGGLTSGDKINIGRFEPGTTVGLVLLSNGWNGSNSEDYKYLVFADKQINPEADNSLKQHNVLLWDAENSLFLLAFEDVRRDNAACDQDFNDAIMFVSSNPVEAISTLNVSPVDKPGTLDADGDGVNDILDEYPNDATKAYDSYYPSATTYGTFSFEDNWPDFGDYDFNDLVIDYQFKHILNAANEVTQIQPTFKIRAIGAGYRNGFGFSTDLNSADIVSVTGHSLNGGYIKTNANGTEAGQTNAVFIVSDNVHDLFNTGGFVNTEEGAAYFEPQLITLDIVLASPKSNSQIGNVPYNPFLIISQTRGREVHLPGYAPTDLVDTDLFGTLDDDTDVAQGIYYRSKSDLPWGIHLPESFDYPKEKSDIRMGHVRFNSWASSQGYSYLDWYRPVNGYRNTTHLYKK